MPHPHVTQLRFARQELRRGLAGLSAEDAVRRLQPMNAISWMIGHLASQENFYWVRLGQGITMAPELRLLVGTGRPASTPPLKEMWETWTAITQAADSFLDTLTPDQLVIHFELREKPLVESIGTMLQRNIYHYWFHIGEALAVRQMLGHGDLPEFVGDMTSAVYRPEGPAI
jgi:hypothetical protein